MGRKRRYDTDKIKDLYENTELSVAEIASEMQMSHGRLSAYLYGTKHSKPLVNVRKRMLPRQAPLTEEQKQAERLYKAKVRSLKLRIARAKNYLAKMKMSQEKALRLRQLAQNEAELSALLLRFHQRTAA